MCQSKTNVLVTLKLNRSPASKKKRQTTSKVVTFAEYIEIREHPRVLGDHPCVSCGPPISIGWYRAEQKDEHQDVEHHNKHKQVCTTIRLPFEEYEISRKGVRGTNDFYLPLNKREQILLEDVGVSTNEIIQASKEADLIKANRTSSYHCQDFDILYLFMEEISSVFEKIFCNNINNGNKTHHDNDFFDYQVQSVLNQGFNNDDNRSHHLVNNNNNCCKQLYHHQQ